MDWRNGKLLALRCGFKERRAVGAGMKMKVLQEKELFGFTFPYEKNAAK